MTVELSVKGRYNRKLDVPDLNRKKVSEIKTRNLHAKAHITEAGLFMGEKPEESDTDTYDS